MKEEKKRTLYLKVRVSPEEMAAIKKKFENSGMSSLSGFVRAMIFEGYIAQVDENELKELTRIRGNSQYLCSSGLLKQGEFGGKNGTAACNQRIK